MAGVHERNGALLVTGSVEHRCPVCGGYEALCGHDARREDEGDLHGGPLRAVIPAFLIYATAAAFVAIVLLSWF